MYAGDGDPGPVVHRPDDAADPGGRGGGGGQGAAVAGAPTHYLCLVRGIAAIMKYSDVE